MRVIRWFGSAMAQVALSGEPPAKGRASVPGKRPVPVGARSRWSFPSAKAPASVSGEQQRHVRVIHWVGSAMAQVSGEPSSDKAAASVSGERPVPRGARPRWSFARASVEQPVPREARTRWSVARASVEQPVPSASRRWCFAIHHYTRAEEEAVKGLASASNDLICGREVGRNGRRHLRGFINLKQKRRFYALKRALGGRAHLEPARGGDGSYRDACSRGGDLLIEAGVPQRERARSDLTSAIGKLKETLSLSEVARSFPEVFVRNHRGLQELLLSRWISGSSLKVPSSLGVCPSLL